VQRGTAEAYLAGASAVGITKAPPATASRLPQSSPNALPSNKPNLAFPTHPPTHPPTLSTHVAHPTLTPPRTPTSQTTPEMLNATEAYETMQSQNTRLLQTITEKDDAAASLAAEKLRLQQQHESLNEQLDAARMEARRLEAEAAEAVAMRDAAGREGAKVAAELAVVRGWGGGRRLRWRRGWEGARGLGEVIKKSVVAVRLSPAS